MRYSEQQLTMIISRATHHLHAISGTISTAFVDVRGEGRILFSNSAISHVSGEKMMAIIRQHYQELSSTPCFMQYELNDDNCMYSSIIDANYTLVMLGTKKDEIRARDFHERLKHMLASAVGH